jgi:hypothetical protein
VVKTRFTQWLLFIALNLLDDYNTPPVLELLKKDEDQLLQAFWDLYADPSAYLPRKISNRHRILIPAQNKAEFHRILIF